MKVSEESVCIYPFRQNPVFTFLHLRSPAHVLPPLEGIIQAVVAGGGGGGGGGYLDQIRRQSGKNGRALNDSGESDLKSLLNKK
jgi:hypothetical protein